MVFEALLALDARRREEHDRAEQHLTEALAICDSDALQQNWLLQWMKPELFAVVRHAQQALTD